MTLLFLAVGLVALAAVATRVRRRVADERHSVRDYQQTLETLRHLSERRTPASGEGNGQRVREERAPAKERPSTVLASSTRPAARGRRAAALAAKSGAPAVSVRVDAPAPRPSKAQPEPAEKVLATAGVAGSAVEASSGSGGGHGAEAPTPARAAQAVRELIAHPELHGPVRSRSMPGARRRPRPGTPVTWTVAAVVVIAVVTGVALAVGPAHSAARRTAPPLTSAPPVTHLSATRPSSSHRASSPPPPAALDPVTSSTTSATYDLPASPGPLTLSASGPCWVQASVPSTGQVLWTGTLQSGQSQTIASTAGALLRLGDASNVRVSVGSEQVHLPSGFALVFDMTFLPA